MIEVEVLFFARAREFAGTAATRISLPEGSCVQAASDRLGETFPELRGLLGTCRFAVNEAFARAEDTIEDGCRIAVIPPVSGG